MVFLKGDFAMQIEAIALAVDLEGRGVHLRREGDQLVAGPPALVTAEDADGITRHRDDLLRLAAYTVPSVS